MNCPRCGNKLDTRLTAGIAAAICGHCAGAWLLKDTLQRLTLRGVEVERCAHCQGVFLDAGEGRTLAQRTVLASAEWDQAYQTLLRTVRTWATPAPEPWLLDAGDFTSSGHGSIE